MNKLVPTRDLHFLVVEDDVVAQEFLRSFLAKFGECDAVKDGLEAILAFSERYNGDPSILYDLVCIDINMPRMGGLLCSRTIRGIEQEQNLSQGFRKTPIIITSTVNDPSCIIKACKECGADHYFIKPLDLKKLTSKMIKFGLITS
jgi:CheY-like chemotaxis protein